VAEAEEPVGSLAQEAAKLFRAIAAERLKLVDDGATTQPDQGPAGEHVCTTGWCPICQVVGYLEDHPELVEQVTETVTDAALQVGRALRDFLDKTMPPDEVILDDK
jgi:hypothetical protein